MEIEKLKLKTKRDFNNVICLMSIIPFLAFLYLLVGKIASFAILSGETGYIMLIVAMLILLGIITGKKILWVLIGKLFDFNQQIINMQKELIEKNKLAAISQTVLSLSHEINNPLLIMQGNLTLLENDFAKTNIPIHSRDRLSQIKSHCERIMEVTHKISSLSKPVSISVHGDTKMIDLSSSE
jgi:signal transduction histidine kinase